MTELERRARELAEVLGIARNTPWEESIAAVRRLTAVNKAVLPASHQVIVGPQPKCTRPSKPTLNPGDAYDAPPLLVHGSAGQETR